jgi:arylsulfatase A-like enzyme
MPKRPHIVIFNPDQWRGDSLAHMGHPAAVTPNLDKLASTDGVSFSRAYCQATVCTPSRASFMSGWYPHVRGHRTMYHMLHQYGNVTDEPVLLQMLKDAGWYTWWGGKNDLSPGQEPTSRYCHVRHHIPHRPEHISVNASQRDAVQDARGEPGSDTYYSFYTGKIELPEEERPYEQDWGHVIGACDMIRDADKDRPLCVYLPLGFPHPAYRVEEPFYSMIDRDKVPSRVPTPPGPWTDKPSLLKGIWERQNMQTWTEDRWTELRATYLGQCARVDYQYGLVVDALKDAGIYDDTAIFFFSDHGDFTGDYGLVEKSQNTFEECITRVPFLVKPPSWVDVKPRVSDALVELIDMKATVEELCGLEPDHTHFGKSLLSVLSGETEEHRDAVFAEGGRREGETHCMELESTSSQSPEGEYWPRVDLQQQLPEHTKAIMCRTATHKYVRRLYEKDELYDLNDDPGEITNVIDDPAYASVLTELKERLLTHYLDTSDVVPHQVDNR